MAHSFRGRENSVIEDITGEPEVEMSVPVNVVDEPEKERLTGEAAEPQVWHEIIKKVRAISTHVTVEVAKHMRTSDPKREAIETEKLRSYDAQLAELQALRKRCENQEKELEKLRQHQRSPVDMEIDGEKPGKSGNKRTVPSFGEAMQYLNRLQSGLTQPKGSSLQTGGQRHASELELRSVDANSSCSQPGAPKRETGRLSFCTDSDVSECQSSRGRREVAREGASAQKGDDPVARYMRHMTLPEVQPYSGQDSNYGFVRFLEDFQLKYPRTNWTDAELCTLFRSKLVGKARTLYEALPSYEKDGGYDALIEAMMRECKAEQRTIKVVALGRLKRLKKRDGQTVSDFCVELEQLTRQAYPELDEYTLAVERAHLLYDQLSHWRDSYYLLEALESEEDTYEKLKEVAKRIERRDMTLEQVKNPRTGEGKAFSKPPRIKEPDLKDRKNVQDRTTREPDFKERRNAQDRTPVCYKCREAGHWLANVRKRKYLPKPGSSLSTRVRGGCCITAEERDTGSSAKATNGEKPVVWVKDDMVILGTNVLPMFGYQLTREGRPLDNPTKTETGAWLQEVVPTIPNPTVAKVARREYIAPGAMSWVQLTGCDKDADWLLDSGIQLIHSGVCHVKKDGLVEVPVINRSSAPVVLKEGESVGQWKEYQTEWIEASAKDIPTDMLTLETRRLSAQQRLMKLKQFLKENRKERKLPARAAKEFDVVDEMNCLHGCFRCQGQPLPILEGVPQLDVSKCHCSASIVAGDLISTLVQPAAAHRVDCVLEGARVIAIWQGCGTLSEKIAWICDPLHRRITPRSVALSYAFFRSRCLHISVMAGMVSADDIMRHWPISGWHCDVPTIFELGWRISTRTTWQVAREAVGAEHRKMVIVVPDCLHRLKQVGSQLRDTKIFYYKQFRDIHLRKTELFDDQLGHVIIVLPPTEPKPGTGPRPQDLNSWYRVAIQARSHLNGFLEDHMELIPQVVDKLVAENGLIDPTAPSYAVAVLDNETSWLPERHVRLFYHYLSRHLAQNVSLEPLPSQVKRTSQSTSTCESYVDKARGGLSPRREAGEFGKRTLRKQEQRKRRSQARALAKNMGELNLDRV
ncbi:hypothetical protein COOONC_02733 [Cooperia oncophora]